jgi:hypothetical protein
MMNIIGIRESVIEFGRFKPSPYIIPGGKEGNIG